VVEAHSGSVEVNSHAPRGTVFRVHLPGAVLGE
jgi:signal transduction histidine kinase